jgi:hypothetical protein
MASLMQQASGVATDAPAVNSRSAPSRPAKESGPWVERVGMAGGWYRATPGKKNPKILTWRPLGRDELMRRQITGQSPVEGHAFNPESVNPLGLGQPAPRPSPAPTGFSWPAQAQPHAQTSSFPLIAGGFGNSTPNPFVSNNSSTVATTPHRPPPPAQKQPERYQEIVSNTFLSSMPPSTAAAAAAPPPQRPAYNPFSQTPMSAAHSLYFASPPPRPQQSASYNPFISAPITATSSSNKMVVDDGL